MNIHFIPGFIGLAKDFYVFSKNFPNHRTFSYDILTFINKNQLSSSSAFYYWADNFNQYIHKNHAKEENLLIGYSLGGRLALHALTQEKHWNRAVIISSNPGLINEEEKKSRVQHDLHWSKKFLTNDWETLMDEWENQAAFCGISNPLERLETDYNREDLAQIMNGFSLGQQNNLREDIEKINIPILWISGEYDKKYKELAHEMAKLNKNISVKIIPKAGHRIPWENESDLTKVLGNFISEIL